MTEYLYVRCRTPIPDERPLTHSARRSVLSAHSDIPTAPSFSSRAASSPPDGPGAPGASHSRCRSPPPPLPGGLPPAPPPPPPAPNLPRSQVTFSFPSGLFPGGALPPSAFCPLSPPPPPPPRSPSLPLLPLPPLVQEEPVVGHRQNGAGEIPGDSPPEWRGWSRPGRWWARPAAARWGLPSERTADTAAAAPRRRAARWARTEDHRGRGTAPSSGWRRRCPHRS